MQACDQTCRWCFRRWVSWWKAREASMSRPSPGITASFSEAAVNSRSRFVEG